MKTVILAGGFGTRFSEETELRPKPMVEIGGKPILWHILKLYSRFGHRDFLICLGYKGYMIKEYFINYFHHMSDSGHRFGRWFGRGSRLAERGLESDARRHGA